MFNYIYLFISLVYIVLLILILKRDLRSLINQSYALFLVGLFLWHVTLYLYLFVDVGDYLLFVGRLNYATGPIFSLGLLGFFHYFPVTTFNIPKWVSRLCWLVTIALVGVTMFTPWIDAMETATEAGPVITLGDGYYFYLAHVFILPVITLVLGAIKNFKLSGLNKLRFEYSFWVFVPTMIAFLACNLILPIFGYIDQFIWSPLFLFPIAISSFYAIAKYRFLDIRLLLARTVAFLFFIFICSAAYAFLLFVVVIEVFGLRLDPFIASIALVVAIFAALSFQPILVWLRKITQLLFYKNGYDKDKLLADLTHIMAQTIDLRKMTSDILQQMISTMGLTKGAFLIVEGGQIIENFQFGYKSADFHTEEFKKFFAKSLKAKRIFEELPENEVKKIFREYDFAITLPIKVKNSMVGLLILGPKLSGEIFNTQDLDFLDIFASESGIAFENARSYEQIKEFNVVLEKKVEERTHQLKQSQQRELAKARDIARLKDEFVFIASHELRAPITAIRGFLELITKSDIHLSKEAKENFGFMSMASDHLYQLINDLLETSRFEAGRMEIAVKPTNILPIIQSIVHEVSPQANKDEVKIAFKAPNAAVMAMVDENKMKEVVMNLLTNAVKYNRKGGTITVSIESHMKGVVLAVKDSGYGIPKGQQDKIFQKFFRASNEKTAQVLGTGLGLFITRILIEKMGGKIHFTSVEGQGTTFFVELKKAEKIAKEKAKKN